LGKRDRCLHAVIDNNRLNPWRGRVVHEGPKLAHRRLSASDARRRERFPRIEGVIGILVEHAAHAVIALGERTQREAAARVSNSAIEQAVG
jgi:hypothetical protein